MKYVPKSRRPWNSKYKLFGDDEIMRDKYYAWQKHRAQANFRGETYELTFDEWQQLWPDDLWFKRGRNSEDLCLTRYDFAGEWAIHNVTVCSRKEHFAIKRNQCV